MIIRLIRLLTITLLTTAGLSSCVLLSQNSKYNFNDGAYRTSPLSKKQVYVLNVDEDTIAVFPIIQFPDSTAILTSRRTNFTSQQRKLRNNKATHNFYRPSFDVDAMALPLKYRPAVDGFPNQLTTNFNGALFGGYRIDAYTLKYKRTPLNMYKQEVKHFGYSAGLYVGIGSTLADASTITQPNFQLQYEGALLITGIATNIAVQNITFGITLGIDHLLDKYHKEWLYEGKPNIAFSLGLNIN